MSTISRIAAENGKAIVPLVSFQKAFYLRVYVRVVQKKTLCQKSMQQMGMIYYGGDSGDHHIHRFGSIPKKKNNYSVDKFEIPTLKSQLDGKRWTPNGPVWLDGLNDYDFVRLLVENMKLIEGGFEFTDEQKELYEDLKDIKLTKIAEINGFLASILAEEPLKDQVISWDMTDLFASIKDKVPRKLDIW